MIEKNKETNKYHAVCDCCYEYSDEYDTLNDCWNTPIDEDGEIIFDEWLCPCCRTRYEVDYDDYKFCPNCGQAIDWSDEYDT